MKLTHIISETVLASVGFSVFGFCLRKLSTIDRITWGTFILCVAVAALFAALRFGGFTEMGAFNLFFKQIAASTGIVFLLLGVYSLVAEKRLPKKTVYGIFFLGFISSVVLITFNLQKVIDIIPTIGIPIVCIFGLWAVRKRNFKIGLLLLSATLFAILANFIQLLNLPLNQIDTYCILLAAALICFGIAGKNTEHLG
jgi:hypothetical protein